MIAYSPTSGAGTCDQLSRALWGLAHPPQEQQGDVTTHMFASIECLDGSVRLEVNTEFAIPVHPDAVLDGIADVLQPWIDEGTLPPDTNANLESLVISLRGQRLVSSGKHSLSSLRTRARRTGTG